MINKKTIRIFGFVALIISTILFGQQKWIDTIPIKQKHTRTPVVKKSNNKILKDIEIEEKKFSTVITLRNYKPGEIEHPSKEIFIQYVKEKIQELRVGKKINKIIVVGWADGTINKGIDQNKFMISNECVYISKNEKIFDLELAKLRGCDIHRRLSSFMYSNSIQLSDLIDGHDEEDNVNTNGAYRKVVITIEF